MGYLNKTVLNLLFLNDQVGDSVFDLYYDRVQQQQMNTGDTGQFYDARSTLDLSID